MWYEVQRKRTFTKILRNLSTRNSLGCASETPVDSEENWRKAVQNSNGHEENWGLGGAKRQRRRNSRGDRSQQKLWYQLLQCESATSAHEAEENCISFSKALRPKSFCKKNLEAPWTSHQTLLWRVSFCSTFHYRKNYSQVSRSRGTGHKFLLVFSYFMIF